MKKILFGLAFTLGVFAFSNAQEIQITNHKNNTVDYGDVVKGSDGKQVVKFKNVGTQPLIIKNVQSTCGCTVPSWPKEPILPGKKGEIVVTYNTNNVGPFHKQITINSNDVKVAALPVKITGTVLASDPNAKTVKK